MREIGSIKWFGKNKSAKLEHLSGSITMLSGDDIYCYEEQFSQKLLSLSAENIRLEEKVVTFEIGQRLDQGKVNSLAVEVRLVDEETEREPLMKGFLSMKPEVWLPAAFRLFDLISDDEVIHLLEQKPEALPGIAYHAQSHIRVAKLLLSTKAQHLRKNLPSQIALRLYAAADNINNWKDEILDCRSRTEKLVIWNDFCRSVSNQIICGSELFFEAPRDVQFNVIKLENNVERLLPCFRVVDEIVFRAAEEKIFTSPSIADTVKLLRERLANRPAEKGIVAKLTSGEKFTLLSPDYADIRQKLTPSDRLALYRIAQDLDGIAHEVIACYSKVTREKWENFCQHVSGKIRYGSQLFYYAPAHVQTSILELETDTNKLITCFLSPENHLWKVAARKLFSTLSEEEVIGLIEKKLRVKPGIKGLLEHAPFSVKTLLLDSKYREIRRSLNIDERLELYIAMPDLEGMVEEVLECKTSEKWNDFCAVIKDRIHYEDAFYSAVPDRLKVQVLARQFRELFQVIQDITQAPQAKFEWKPEEIYSRLDQDDRNLTKKWMAEARNLPEKMRDGIEAQMLSARGAEKVAQMFYRSLGYQVTDIAITQLRNHSEDWKTYDLLLKMPLENSTIFIDVKNARTSIGSRLIQKRNYVDHCVPRFKKSRSGDNVKIAGVLSPYLNLENIQKPQLLFYQEPLTFLGELTKEVIEDLEAEFRKMEFHEITILTRDSTSAWVAPAWAFDYPSIFYRMRNQNRERLRGIVKGSLPTLAEFEMVGINPLPAFLASRIPLPSRWQDEITRGQRYFYNLCVHKSRIEISLPFLFLMVLTHFLEMLVHKDRWDAFEPVQYRQLLYETNVRHERPLGIVDPLGVIDDLIDTLSILWTSKGSFNLHEFDTFSFYGLGLLRGRRKGQHKYETILAYCGGEIEKKGKCGRSPLIIGREKSCEICGRLICPDPECGFCSYDYRKQLDCPGRNQRKNRQLIEAPV